MSRAWVLYTDFSNARAITGVILIPLQSCLPLGMSILGRGVTWALFHEEGYFPVFNETFEILWMTLVKISAWSLQIQKGLRSGPIAVFFRRCKQFHTYLSDIWGASKLLSAIAGTGFVYASSVHKSAKKSFSSSSDLVSNITLAEMLRRCNKLSTFFHHSLDPTGAFAGVLLFLLINSLIFLLT